jgi:mannose-6-phosphate isomerase-like protein (cupin superfamily)
MLVVHTGSEVLGNVEVKLDAASTNRAFSIFELTVAPGNGSRVHHHTNEHEAMVVLEGQLTVIHAERHELLHAGDTVLFPRGIRHSFTNHGPAVVRALVVTAPGGLENLFREIAAGTEADEAAKNAGIEVHDR